MKINSRFEYPTIERITLDNGSRYYICPLTGQHLTSVTTILDSTKDKTFLKEWEDRVGKVKADQIRKEATDLGTLMHTHLECYVMGEPRPRGNNLVRQMAERMANKIIENGLGDVDEVWGMEAQLYTPGLYAGTTDLVGLYKGQPAILDYKTAKKMRTCEQVMDYADQLAAYAISHNELYGTDINTGVVFMVSRDLEYKTFVFEGAEFLAHKESFLNRVGQHLAAVAA